MIDAIRAELSAMEARYIERLETFTHAMLHLAEHAIHQRNPDMSKLTDAIDADLTSLETTVANAVAHATETAQSAVADEEAKLDGFRTRIEAVRVQVEGMVPTVAAAVAPAASASVVTDAVAAADETALHTA